MRPFSLELYKKGVPVITRSGHEVEILKTDFKSSSTSKVMITVIKFNDYECARLHDQTGKCDNDYDYDLMHPDEELYVIVDGYYVVDNIIYKSLEDLKKHMHYPEEKIYKLVQINL